MYYNLHCYIAVKMDAMGVPHDTGILHMGWTMKKTEAKDVRKKTAVNQVVMGPMGFGVPHFPLQNL